MHARMLVIQATPARLDEAICLLHERSADVRRLPGFQHGHLLVDRQRGELVTMTLWESEQAMHDVQPRARELLSGALQAFAGEVPPPRQYEVAFDF